MLRYLRCVQKMKQIIHENNLTVMATNARYVSNLCTVVGDCKGGHAPWQSLQCALSCL